MHAGLMFDIKHLCFIRCKQPCLLCLVIKGEMQKWLLAVCVVILISK